MKLYPFYTFQDTMTTLPPALLLFKPTPPAGAVQGRPLRGIE